MGLLFILLMDAVVGDASSLPESPPDGIGKCLLLVLLVDAGIVGGKVPVISAPNCGPLGPHSSQSLNQQRRMLRTCLSLHLLPVVLDASGLQVGLHLVGHFRVVLLFQGDVLGEREIDPLGRAP